MNGKKKAVSFVVVVAFLLCGVFGGLVTEQSLAFQYGYTGKGDQWQTYGAGENILMIYNQTFSVPEDYYIELSSFSAFVKPATGATATGTIMGCVYDSNLQIVANGTTYANVTAQGWVSIPMSVSLLSGDYYIGLWFDNDTSAAYRFVSWTYSNYTSISEVPDTLVVGGAFGAVVFSAFVEYSVVPFQVTQTNMIDTGNWGGLLINLFLVGVSIVLALKSKSWAVNFLFGLSMVGFLGWTFANAVTEVYGGWLLFMVLVGAVLVLVKGAVLVRASGV